MTHNAIRGVSLIDDAALTSGGTFWSTKEDDQGRRVLLTDGPHGVRYQAGQADHLGIAASEPATCFPPAAGLGQSWDPELARIVGAALAVEARHYGVGVLLGPGINIRRDPRGGRNFEYYSEDPHLSGVLGSAWVRGLQSGGIGASVKHFAANNSETDRMRTSSNVAARPLREIYLRAFERVVKDASPWTVMCSYNKINGILASENKWLLTDVLRGDWGFDGAVVSDWGAVADRVAAVSAGLDLTMPGGGTAAGDEDIVDAVRAGVLEADLVEQAADRVTRLIDRVTEGAASVVADLDLDAHHELARIMAANSIVLLKNDSGILPLTSTSRIAVVGQFAMTPRFQGGGSSHVNAAHVDIPFEQIAERAADVTYSPGTGPGALASAVEAASRADVALVFLGLADHQETEGVDRTDIGLPAEQLELLRAVVAARPETVVVLSHGGVVDLTEVDRLAPAIVDGALLGQGGGHAISEVVFGDVNPSAKLTETVPMRLQDAPSYLNFPGEHSQITYGEGIFVGYRGYDARDVPVLYPFGHGLSYTAFSYGEITATTDDSGVTLSLPITNTGSRAGREVVQFYSGLSDSGVQRAPRELRAFAAVTLAPGETSVATAHISRGDLAYWEDRTDAWVVEGGHYTVWAASSSRDLRSSVIVTIEGDDPRVPLTAASTLGEILAHPIAGPAFGQAMGGGLDTSEVSEVGMGADMQSLTNAIPLDRLGAMSGGVAVVDAAAFAPLFDMANAPDICS
ncbi:beta-glucosidase [Frigoribacterium sp. PvP054]|uniref:glycoside hydrolase family 3 C-terminal domain-containing protein n=1 Tax=Frigoribacterium sp. PvP054 TaxID=3156438 RepID=UPI0033966A99